MNKIDIIHKIYQEGFLSVFKKICHILTMYLSRSYLQIKLNLYAILFNSGNLEAIEKKKFYNYFGCRDKAIDHINNFLRREKFNIEKDSIHWVLFSAIALFHMKKIKKILEIGTYNGETTRILAELFPNATVTTIELPENDPLLRGTYGRKKDSQLKKFEYDLKNNLNRPNIRSIRVNSLFTLEHCEKGYDLIWVDGGHHFPEIAWDISNAYYLANKGGIIMYDDVYISSKAKPNALVSVDLFKTINYLSSRTQCSLEYFLKRHSKESKLIKESRKYVGVMFKN